jgi:hypothetical protein
VEIADAAGEPITVMRIGNDSAGFAPLLPVIAEVPGSQVAVSIEDSRRYGIGLAKALSATELLVIECEQLPTSSGEARAGPTRSTPCTASKSSRAV